MELCSEDHDEICFDGRKCPFCVVTKDLEQQIKDLRIAIEDLEDYVRDLKRENTSG